MACLTFNRFMANSTLASGQNADFCQHSLLRDVDHLYLGVKIFLTSSHHWMLVRCSASQWHLSDSCTARLYPNRACLQRHENIHGNFHPTVQITYSENSQQFEIIRKLKFPKRISGKIKVDGVYSKTRTTNWMWILQMRPVLIMRTSKRTRSEQKRITFEQTCITLSA